MQKSLQDIEIVQNDLNTELIENNKTTYFDTFKKLSINKKFEETMFSISMLIDLEMQNKHTEESLGYNLYDRILFYACRGISHQKVDDYKIVPFSTIWIITVPKDHALVNQLIKFNFDCAKFFDVDEIDCVLDEIRKDFSKTTIIIYFYNKKGEGDDFKHFLDVLISDKYGDNVRRKELKNYGINIKDSWGDLEEAKNMTVEQAKEILLAEREEGIKEGREEGIKNLIEEYLDFGLDEDKIICRLIKKYCLKKDEAEVYYRKYS